MKDLFQLSPGDLVVWITPRAELAPILDWIAVYALRGPVRVLDSGDRFEVKQLVRFLRRRTHQITETLSRIHASRISTSHQLIHTLEETPAGAIPHLFLDFLATFEEENLPAVESYYLLGITISHLHRLRKFAPVVVCVHPARVQQPERAGLAEVVLELADQVFTPAIPRSTRPTQLL
ncbi:MAG: hypothetical protein Fur0022_27660 [Anaerolineales bacterium]